MNPIKDAMVVITVIGVLLTRRYYKEWIVPASAVALPFPGKAASYLTAYRSAV
jgi:hypothetical protein